MRMHDWTLVSVLFEWKSDRVILSFETWETGLLSVVAEGVVDLHVPHVLDWGRSVSVNEVEGPSSCGNGLEILKIEMQSGDTIEIKAQGFNFPPEAAMKP